MSARLILKQNLTGNPPFLHQFLQPGIDLQGAASHAARACADEDPLLLGVQGLTVEFLHAF